MASHTIDEEWHFDGYDIAMMWDFILKLEKFTSVITDYISLFKFKINSTNKIKFAMMWDFILKLEKFTSVTYVYILVL